MDEIKFTLEVVTPDIAQQYLEKNIRNRKPRRQVVNEMCSIIEKSEWRIVHQPIAFDGLGRLVDGQHRLMAIVKTGEAVPMYVARYRNEESAMNLPIDRQSRRTVSDILEADKKTTETVSAIIEMSMGGNRRVPTIGEVSSAMRYLQPELHVMHEICNHTAPKRSAQSIRGAVVCAMKSQGMTEEIARQYRAFLLLDFASCKPSVLAFIKTCDGHSGGGGSSRREMFIRALKAFLPNNWLKSVNRISADDSDWRNTIQTARESLGLE